MRRWLASFSLLGSLLLPVLSWATSKTCLTGTDASVAADAGQIAAVRAQTDAACFCASFDGSKGKTHGNYVACVSSVINAQVKAGQLRTQCKATVRKYYAASTCGVPAGKSEAPCIKTTAAGKVSCSVKPTARCTGPGDVACPSFTTCIDAADANHDGLIGVGDSGACASSQSGPTNTPTTPVGAPSPTTTPTPGAKPGLCGNGTVDAGEQCDGQPFCGSDCQLVPIAFNACCEFDVTQAVPFSMCGDGGFATDSAIYHTCIVAGGMAWRGRACTACTGACPQVTPPPAGSGLIPGTCQASTFPPTSVCCQRQTSCVAQIVSSSEDLGGFVDFCLVTSGSTSAAAGVLSAYDLSPSSVPVVAGTCSAQGTCITP